MPFTLEEEQKKSILKMWSVDIAMLSFQKFHWLSVWDLFAKKETKHAPQQMARKYCLVVQQVPEKEWEEVILILTALHIFIAQLCSEWSDFRMVSCHS